VRGGRQARPPLYFVLRRAINMSSLFLQKRSLFVTVTWDVSLWRSHGVVLCVRFPFLLTLRSSRRGSTSTQGKRPNELVMEGTELQSRLLSSIFYGKMYWLMGRHSALSVHNKLMLYQQVLKPVRAYGIQLWGCTRNVIQRFQNRILRGKDSRIEYSVASWIPLGTFEMTTFIRIWMWKLSIASSKRMPKVMNKDYIGTST
jgi:hypothetical protein